MAAGDAVGTRTDRKKIARHANYKFPHGHSFVDQDLVNADFRGASVIRCDFGGANLSYANFEGANCYEADFSGANLYRANFKDAILAGAKMMPRDLFGATFTLTCDTFQGMEVGHLWNMTWFYMALLMKQNEKPELREQIIALIGKDRVERLDKMFKDRII